MRHQTPPTLLTTALAVLALAIFHSARPLAVSAQARATLTASATVVHADAAWTGHELTEAVVRASRVAEDTEAVRSERNGTVVWVRPASPRETRTFVTVAHLGS